MLEVSLIIPIVSFFFVGALDLGYYSFALISLQNALRVATLYTSTSSATSADAVGACQYVVGEMSSVPNISKSTTCSGDPLTVSVTAVTSAGGVLCSQVTVTYKSMAMIPIPGFLTSNQFTWSRTLTMPIRS